MHSSLSLSNIERQKHILELLGRRPRITVAEICEQFSVSEATARRDLDALVDQGKVQRIHGARCLWDMHRRSYQCCSVRKTRLRKNNVSGVQQPGWSMTLRQFFWEVGRLYWKLLATCPVICA